MQFAESRYQETNASVFMFDTLFLQGPNGDDDLPVEGDWDDEEDEDFDDQTESTNDLHEIQVDDDLGEPDPEDDDHLPDEELQ
jgi:hypothetical protein